MSSNPPHFYEFGPFRLDPSAPLLLRDERPVPLTPKALETLVFLVKHGGRVVSREELIEAVWPDVEVEENNLSVNVSALRKALGETNGREKYIETVPRRGYRFTAAVRDVPVESIELIYTKQTRSLTITEETSESESQASSYPASRAVSIAVLPFKQIGSHSGEEYLGIGLCDTLITRLSRVPRFALRPTSSVVLYGDERAEPLTAGRELKVDYVVDGRIRRAGEKLRVNVQLLRISEEAICWAGQFDEKLTDVLQLEDSIAEQVAAALVPHMTAAERQRLARRGTDNPEAFEAYLRGRFHFNSLTEDGFAKAFAAYERAVQLDQSYALAHTGIAEYHYFLAVWGVMPSSKCLAASEAAARRAVEIDPDLAEAHAALGFALAGRFKWTEGERHVLRSLELSPNSALAHLRYGNHLVQQGFVEDALQQARCSLELDPSSPIYQFSLGWAMYFARRFEESFNQYQSMIAAQPLNPMAYLGLAWVARHVGRHEEALSAMKRAEELSNGSLMMKTARGQAYAAAGMRREAEEVLSKVAALPTECYVIPYHIALIHHYLGDKEKTLLALEEAFEHQDLWLVWIGVEPAFDDLRSDPRFQRLLELTGLKQSSKITQATFQSAEITHTRHTRSLTLIEETSETEKQAVAVARDVATELAPLIATDSIARRRRKTGVALLAVTVCLAAAIAAYFYLKGRPAPKAETSIPAVRSIAVLPLKAITTNEDDETLSLGLAEALIARLGSSQKIIVRPLSSVTQRTVTASDALEVGRALQVDAIMDGSFQRAGNRLRVRVRLLRIADGTQIWVGTFDEIESDIFKLQDAISLEAASALALNLSEPQRALVLKRYTENAQAYQAYLRGVYLQRKFPFDEKSFAPAIAEYERALQLDPGYALAHTGLAGAYAWKANKSSGEEHRRFYEMAKAAALKALALDENLAEAHSSLGWVRRIYDWDWVESERRMTRAIELAPHEARFRRSYVFLLITLGRTEEAVAEARKAHELDPTYNSNYAFALSSNRQIDEAIVEYLKATELNNDLSAWHALVEQYFAKGDYAEALRVSERAPPQAKSRGHMKMILAMIYFHSGEKEKAQEILHEFEASARAADGNDARLAALYAEIGRKDDAIAALQRGFATRDDRMMWIKTNPHFDSLRDDPRFQEILQKMKL